MKALLFAFSLFCMAETFAQDVIVKKDGSTILAKIQKVGTSEIEYKKHSNPDGPIYAIAKSDVVSINYENGQRDIMENDGDTPSSPQGASNLKSSAEVVQANSNWIKAYNGFSSEYTSNKTGGDAKRAFWALAIDESSILQDDNLALEVSIGQVSFGNARGASSQVQFSKGFSKGLNYYYFLNQALQIALTNKTSKTIYIDLGTSFYKRGSEASPYYVPSSVSNMNSSTTGVSVGIPTIFGSIGVGNAHTHAVTVTTYSQRIIAIPPKSTKTLEAEMLFPKDFAGIDGVSVNYSPSRMGYYPIVNTGKNTSLSNGEKVMFTANNSPISIGAYITYGFDENFTQSGNLYVGLFARDVIGFPYPSGAAAFCANVEKHITISGRPLYFITTIDDGVGKNGYMELK